MDIWVRITTDEDRFDNPDKPTMQDIEDVLRNPGNYGITDYYRDEDIVVTSAITD